MPFVLRSADQTENPNLAAPYGKQITAAQLAYYVKDGGRTRCILFLGEGEMDGIDKLLYRGEEIPEFTDTTRNWRFHPGTITTQPTFVDLTSFQTGTTGGGWVHLASPLGIVNDPVAFMTGHEAVLPTNVIANKQYYITHVSGNDIKISDLLGGTPFDFDVAGTGDIQAYKANKGYFDPIQGRPEFFPDIKFTFSRIAYVEVYLNTTMSDMEEEPTSFKIFVRGKKVQNYNANGDKLNQAGVIIDESANGSYFSANNALIALDILLNYMNLDKTRIDFPSWVAYRDYCDAIIEWNSGTIPVMTNPSWVLTDAAESPIGSLRKTTLTNDTNNWDSGGYTVQTVALADQSDIRISFVYRSGHVTVGIVKGSPGFDPHNHLYAIHCSTLTNQVYVFKGNTLLYSSSVGAFAPSDSFEMRVTAAGVNFYRNSSIFFSTTSTDLNAGNANPVRGVVGMVTPTSLVEDVEFFPVVGEDRAVNRFDAHIVFPQQLQGTLALEQVFARSPGCHWQDVGGKVSFIVGPTFKEAGDPSIVPGDRVCVGTLNYDPTQSVVSSNIVEDSFNIFRKPAEEKDNFLVLEFRDLDDIFYTKKYSYTDRPKLKAQAGQIVQSAATIPIGVATQSLADRIGEATLRFGSDLDLFVQLKGVPSNLSLAKGDIVRLAHEIPGWTIAGSPPVFIVLEETFEEASDSSDDRAFTLQVYKDDFYSDTAHGAITAAFPVNNTSPLVPPLVIEDLELTEAIAQMSNESYVSSIRGEVSFAKYANTQHGRVYTKALETRLGKLVLDSSTDVFTLTDAEGNYVEPPDVDVALSLVSTSNNLPGNLDVSQEYHTRFISGNTFKLSKTAGGGAVNFSSDGSDLELYLFSDWEPTNLVVQPDIDNKGLFEIIPAKKAYYYVKVPTYSSAEASLAFSVHPYFALQVEGNLSPPDSPTDLRYTFNGVNINWEFNPSPSTDVVGYQVTDENEQLIKNFITNLEFSETAPGTSAIRRVYAISVLGVRSIEYAEAYFIRPPILIWENIVGATVDSDGTWRKTASGDWGNSGAILNHSLLTNAIKAKVGYTIDSVDQFKMFGFAKTANVTTYEDFYYAVYLYNDGTLKAVYNDSGSPVIVDIEDYHLGERVYLAVDVWQDGVVPAVKIQKDVKSRRSIVQKTIYTFPELPVFFPAYVGISAYDTNATFKPNLEITGDLILTNGKIPVMENLTGSVEYDNEVGELSGVGEANSVEQINAFQDGAFSFKLNPENQCKIGLTNDVGEPYIGYHIEVDSKGNLKLFEYDVELSVLGDFESSDIFHLTRENRILRVRKNGVLLSTDEDNTAYPDEPLKLKIILIEDDAPIESILFEPAVESILNRTTENVVEVGATLDKSVVGNNLTDEIPKFNIDYDEIPNGKKLLYFNDESEVTNLGNDTILNRIALVDTLMDTGALQNSDTIAFNKFLDVDGFYIFADIISNAVQFSQLRTISTNKLLGRSTAGTGDIEQVSIGTGLTLSAGTLSNSLTGVPSMTGNSGKFLTNNGSAASWGIPLTTGNSVSGGAANRVLYEDASQNLATNSKFLFDGTNLIVGTGTQTGGLLQLRAITEQARFEYDATNRLGITIGSTGITTLDAIGSASQFILNDPTSVIGDFKFGNVQTISLNRTLPTTVGNGVDIGSFTLTNGAASFDILLTVPSSGYSQAKRYIVPVFYDASTNTWFRVPSVSSTSPLLSGDEIELDVNVSSNIVYFRLRRALGTTAGIAYITIVQSGINSDPFTPSTSTGTITPIPTNYWPYSFADSLQTKMLQVNKLPPVSLQGSYLYYNWNSTGNAIPAVLTTATDNGGTTLNAAEPALVLTRNGKQVKALLAYTNIAEFKISRYENVSNNARTALTLALTHGAGDAAGTDVISFYSDKTIRPVEGGNFVFGTTTGTMIGTGATQKIGFYGVTPVTQRTNIGAIADFTGGTAANTISAVSSTFTASEFNDINAIFIQRINRLEQVLQDLGLTT